MSAPKTPHAFLAIESSCDETAVALVSPQGEVLFEAVYSQIDIHRKFGGVVPEVASRSHFEKIDHLTQQALEVANKNSIRLMGIAATQGPGLVGALLVGSSYAHGLASGLKVPFLGIHHLRGHIASALLGRNTQLTLKDSAREVFPALVLLVSGGHTQVLEVDPQLHLKPLIQSVDDAAGECFDKCAKLMGLPYPGGPQIEKIAATLEAIDHEKALALSRLLPRPKTQDGDFSFSGLKTAFRLWLEKNPDQKAKPFVCWALQEVIGDILVDGLHRSLEKLGPLQSKSLVFCGGVSANKSIRNKIEKWAEKHSLQLALAPLKYCTDNAAMIAAAAFIQDPCFLEPRVFARKELR